MRLGTSYGQIFRLSLPIMMGSAAQNIIVLSDNVFCIILIIYNLRQLV